MQRADFEMTVRFVLEKHGFSLSDKSLAALLGRTDGGFRHSMCCSDLPLFSKLRSVRIRHGRKVIYPTIPTLRIVFGFEEGGETPISCGDVIESQQQQSAQPIQAANIENRNPQSRSATDQHCRRGDAEGGGHAR